MVEIVIMQSAKVMAKKKGERKEPKRVQYNVRVREDLIKAIKIIASSRGTYDNDIIEAAIRDIIDKDPALQRYLDELGLEWRK